MCNLYRMDKSAAEVARLFGVAADPGANFAAELYPGYPGLVVAEGQLRTMTWGFPLSLTGRQGQKLKPKPVTNAREDKLFTAFWRDSFAHRRCLIPVSAWAEAEGEKGRMTRTWYGVKGEDPFAVAGLWRPTQEWGNAYAMVMSMAVRKWPRCTTGCRLSSPVPIGSAGLRLHPNRLSPCARLATASYRWSAMARRGPKSEVSLTAAGPGCADAHPTIAAFQGR